MTALELTLKRLSPRFAQKPIAWPSVAIRSAALILFCALLVPLFVRDDVFAWSLGIFYISYDTGLLIFTALKIRNLKAGPAPETASSGQATQKPSLAIIVAAHNEAPVLSATIEALRAQSDPPDLIIIADDGSTDATGAVLAHYYQLEAPPLGALSAPSPRAPNLHWLRLSHGGKARALNQAIPLAETDIVITVDADTKLDQGAVAAMRAAFASEPQLVAATGVLTPTCGQGAQKQRALNSPQSDGERGANLKSKVALEASEPKTSLGLECDNEIDPNRSSPDALARVFAWFQRYEYIRNFLSRYAWMEARGLLLISGAFAAFRRDALIEVGGFDPDCLVEDYELIHRLYRRAADQNHDWRIRVIGAAHAHTDAPATPMSFLRQRRRWFSGFLETQHWNRDMIGNPRFGSLGRAMMPVKTMDTLQPIFGLAAFVILIGFVARGDFTISLAVLGFMGAKILIDLCFHLWSLRIYARWTGQERLGARPALLAVFLEPFTFQLLRHAGAAWGWIGFLTGHRIWGRRSRLPQTATAEA
jgi:cellulose synthase/poly-beta-1,6-N-acetylglucosamine synthase-like glycosyltransferase